MYTNLLTQLKNAQAARKENIKVNYSKMDEKIAEILKSEGYLENVEHKGRGPKKILDLKLKYLEGNGAISGVKFISKPSRRIYLGYADIRPIKQGYGLLVVSTPKGIMTGKRAKKEKVGGVALFEIW